MSIEIHIVSRPYEGCILAAFSTYEKAEEYIKLNGCPEELDIDSLKVDEDD